MRIFVIPDDGPALARRQYRDEAVQGGRKGRARRGFSYANAKMRFQSFFMLMMVHFDFFAWS